MNVESLIGQYKILRTLGTGGMGTVYLGEHLLLGRRAAIKMLPAALSGHRDVVDRFFSEVRAISSISDAGVVRIFDFGYHVDGTAYVVMEYLEGESLAARLDRRGRLSIADALRTTHEIASSLGAAHARGIIHRDLKPCNVFLIEDSAAPGGERVKILDFGIARLLSSPADLVATQTGTLRGTPVYMSPEQCRGTGKIDHRSDIYSVGCALFHMLTGVPPFDCDSTGDYIAAHLREDPPAPSELALELSTALDALVLRCLAKNPADRFQTMAELGLACEDILAPPSEPGTSPRTPPDDALSDRASQGWGPWFDESSSANDDAFDDDERQRGRNTTALGRLALALALFVGLVAGIVITDSLLDDVSPTIAAVGTPPSSDHAAPSRATTRELAPPQPLTGLDGLVDPDAPESDAPSGDTSAPTTKSEHASRVRRRARTRWSPPPPPPRRPPTSEPEEDLYDTR